MSEFVEQCRAEWRRLGVADPLAEEMAADLTSDLEEAEAEGVSAAEYLGGSASDPRSFAASWASERGIIPAPPNRETGRRRPRAFVAFTALAAITVVIAALLLATGEPKVALKTTRRTPPHLPVPPAHPSLPAGTGHQVQAGAAAPVEWILLVVAIAALGFSAWLWLRWNRSRPPVTSPGSQPRRDARSSFPDSASRMRSLGAAAARRARAHVGWVGLAVVTVIGTATLAAGCGGGTAGRAVTSAAAGTTAAG